MTGSPIGNKQRFADCSTASGTTWGVTMRTQEQPEALAVPADGIASAPMDSGRSIRLGSQRSTVSTSP